MASDITLAPVGHVRSTLVHPTDAPRQGDEGAPEAWVDLLPDLAAALDGIVVGDRLVLVTWLHLADRSVRVVRPRDEPTRRPVGVFATRSPDRPNPIGLHEVEVREVAGVAVRVAGLEAVDGTPVLDLKPVLGPPGSR